MNEPSVKILLVEDNPGDARLLLEMLNGAGDGRFQVTQAGQLGQAIAHLRRSGFDAMLLDLSLPDSQGLQTVVEAHEHAPQVPIIVLTGLDDEEVAVEAVRQGAQDYLVKGQTDAALLMRSIQYSIERKGVERELEKSRDELENRVRQRTKDLERAILALQAEVGARIKAESEVLKVNRALRMISECDQAMVRATQEEAMLADVCRLIVEIGGYRMAWVGMASREENKSVIPAAQYGLSADELKKARLTWADTERGRGPTGTAIRTGKRCLVGNLLNNPDMAPWRDQVVKLGAGSAISLPLISGGAVLGAMTFCAAQPEAFDSAETALLEELSNDLAFGITALRAREDRRRLEAEVLRASEMERQRIGHELHDLLGQNLTGISFLCNVLCKGLQKKSLPEAEEAAEIEKLVNQSVELTRSLSKGLSPVGISAEGLMTSLQEFVASVEEMFKVSCNLLCDTHVLVRDSVAAAHLYRIVQEAVNNAVRHGKAGNINIRLQEEGDSIVLRVEDDGIGLPPDLERPEGMGIRIMNYRANIIGGSLRVEPNHKGGTTVTCVWGKPPGADSAPPAR